MTTDDPYAEHEARLEQLRADRDEEQARLQLLSEVPQKQRDSDWMDECDDAATALRQLDDAIKSAELGRTQAENFADAMAPATITAEQEPDTPEE